MCSKRAVTEGHGQLTAGHPRPRDRVTPGQLRAPRHEDSDALAGVDGEGEASRPQVAAPRLRGAAQEGNAPGGSPAVLAAPPAPAGPGAGGVPGPAGLRGAGPRGTRGVERSIGRRGDGTRGAAELFIGALGRGTAPRQGSAAPLSTPRPAPSTAPLLCWHHEPAAFPPPPPVTGTCGRAGGGRAPGGSARGVGRAGSTRGRRAPGGEGGGGRRGGSRPVLPRCRGPHGRRREAPEGYRVAPGGVTGRQRGAIGATGGVPGVSGVSRGRALPTPRGSAPPPPPSGFGALCSEPRYRARPAGGGSPGPPHC